MDERHDVEEVNKASGLEGTLRSDLIGFVSKVVKRERHLDSVMSLGILFEESVGISWFGVAFGSKPDQRTAKEILKAFIQPNTDYHVFVCSTLQSEGQRVNTCTR
jgi:hypothetical protein